MSWAQEIINLYKGKPPNDLWGIKNVSKEKQRSIAFDKIPYHIDQKERFEFGNWIILYVLHYAAEGPTFFDSARKVQKLDEEFTLELFVNSWTDDDLQDLWKQHKDNQLHKEAVFRVVSLGKPVNNPVWNRLKSRFRLPKFLTK